jgi:hypothetical protein
VLARVFASLLCLLGAASAGLGVASATVWRPSDTLTASTSATGFLVTDPGVLDLAGDSVTVTARAAGPVVIALGTTGDVDAWVGGSRATHVTGLTSRTELATSVGKGATTPSSTMSAGTTSPSATASAAPTSPSATASAAPTSPSATASAGTTSPSASPTAAPTSSSGTAALPAETNDPTGSDLWVRQVTGEGTAELTWQRTDGRWSLLVAAPKGGLVDLTLSWPQTVTTPWLRPGIAAGGVLVVLGAAWWVLLLVRARRGSAGTRRVRQPSRRRVAPEADVPAAGPAEPVTAAARPAGRHSSHAASAPADEPTPAPAPTGRTRHGRRAAPVEVPVEVPGVGPVVRPAELPVPVADVPATTEPPVDVPASAITVPLTRRALREMREREARQGEAQRATGSEGAHGEPQPENGAAPAVVASGSTPHAVTYAPGAFSGEVAGPTDAARTVAEPSVPAPAAPKGRGTRRGPLSRLRRRRPVEPEPWSTEPEPLEPVALPEPPAASGPSADAWRRAWGLPGATSQPGQAAGADDQEEGR